MYRSEAFEPGNIILRMFLMAFKILQMGVRNPAQLITFLLTIQLLLMPDMVAAEALDYDATDDAGADENNLAADHWPMPDPTQAQVADAFLLTRQLLLMPDMVVSGALEYDATDGGIDPDEDNLAAARLPRLNMTRSLAADTFSLKKANGFNIDELVRSAAGQKKLPLVDQMRGGGVGRRLGSKLKLPKGSYPKISMRSRAPRRLADASLYKEDGCVKRPVFDGTFASTYSIDPAHGLNGNETVRASSVDSKGRTWLAYSSTSFGYGDDIVAMCLANDGEVLLSKWIALGHHDTPHVLEIDSNDNVVIAVTTTSFNSDDDFFDTLHDILLVKLSPQGDEIFTKAYQAHGQNNLLGGFALDEDDNIWLAVYSIVYAEPGKVTTGNQIIRFDPDGNLSLIKAIESPGSLSVTQAITVVDKTDVLISGTIHLNPASKDPNAFDIFVMRCSYDLDTVHFTKAWKGDSIDHASTILVDKAHQQMLISGSSNSTQTVFAENAGTPPFDGILLRIGFNGSLLSHHSIGSVADDWSKALALTQNGHILVGGAASIDGETMQDGYIIEVDSHARFVRGFYFGGQGGEEVKEIHILEDGKIHITGNSRESFSEGYNGFVALFDNNFELPHRLSDFEIKSILGTVFYEKTVFDTFDDVTTRLVSTPNPLILDVTSEMTFGDITALMKVDALTFNRLVSEPYQHVIVKGAQLNYSLTAQDFGNRYLPSDLYVRMNSGPIPEWLTYHQETGFLDGIWPVDGPDRMVLEVGHKRSTHSRDVILNEYVAAGTSCTGGHLVKSFPSVTFKAITNDSQGALWAVGDTLPYEGEVSNTVIFQMQDGVANQSFRISMPYSNLTAASIHFTAQDAAQIVGTFNRSVIDEASVSFVGRGEVFVANFNSEASSLVKATKWISDHYMNAVKVEYHKDGSFSLVGVVHREGAVKPWITQIFVMRFQEDDGSMLFAKELGRETIGDFVDIAANSQGHLWLVANYLAPEDFEADPDVLIARLSLQADVDIVKKWHPYKDKLSPNVGMPQHAKALLVDDNDHLIVSGWGFGFSGSEKWQIFMAKFDENAQLLKANQWKTLALPGGKERFAMSFDHKGDIWLAVPYGPTDGAFAGLGLMHYSSDLELIEVVGLAEPRFGSANTIFVDYFNNILTAGFAHFESNLHKIPASRLLTELFPSTSVEHLSTTTSVIEPGDNPTEDVADPGSFSFTNMNLTSMDITSAMQWGPQPLPVGNSIYPASFVTKLHQVVEFGKPWQTTLLAPNIDLDSINGIDQSRLAAWLDFNYADSILSGTPEGKVRGKYRFPFGIRDFEGKFWMFEGLAEVPNQAAKFNGSNEITWYINGDESSEIVAEGFYDVEGDTLTYGIANTPGRPLWVRIDENTAIVYATLISKRQGTYSLIVTATDDCDNDDYCRKVATQDIKIIVPNRVPEAEFDIPMKAPPSYRAGRGKEDYTILPDSFSDADNDNLVYNATYGGGDLPPFMNFNPNLRLLQTDLEEGHAGNYTIDISVSDGYSISKSRRLVIRVHDNRAPHLTMSLMNQTAYCEELSPLILPRTLFKDEDGGLLTYKAMMRTGSGQLKPVEVWLGYNGGINAFNILPRSTNQGLYQIIVTAFDDFNASTSTSFWLNVTDRAPKSIKEFLGLKLGSFGSFEYPLDGHFEDPDRDALHYSLPNNTHGWISYDNETRALIGTSPPWFRDFAIIVRAKGFEKSNQSILEVTFDLLQTPSEVFGGMFAIGLLVLVMISCVKTCVFEVKAHKQARYILEKIKSAPLSRELKAMLKKEYFQAPGAVTASTAPGAVTASTAPGAVTASTARDTVPASTALGAVTASTAPGAVTASTAPGAVTASTAPGAVTASTAPGAVTASTAPGAVPASTAPGTVPAPTARDMVPASTLEPDEIEYEHLKYLVGVISNLLKECNRTADVSGKLIDLWKHFEVLEIAVRVYFSKEGCADSISALFSVFIDDLFQVLRKAVFEEWRGDLQEVLAKIMYLTMRMTWVFHTGRRKMLDEADKWEYVDQLSQLCNRKDINVVSALYSVHCSERKLELKDAIVLQYLLSAQEAILSVHDSAAIINDSDVRGCFRPARCLNNVGEVIKNLFVLGWLSRKASGLWSNVPQSWHMRLMAYEMCIESVDVGEKEEVKKLLKSAGREGFWSFAFSTEFFGDMCNYVFCIKPTNWEFRFGFVRLLRRLLERGAEVRPREVGSGGDGDGEGEPPERSRATVEDLVAIVKGEPQAASFRQLRDVGACGTFGTYVCCCAYRDISVEQYARSLELGPDQASIVNPMLGSG